MRTMLALTSLAAALLFSACQNPGAKPASSASPAASPSPAPAATATAAATATPAAPTATPTAAATAKPAATAAPTVSFKAQVVPILQKHCAECHMTGKNPNVPFVFFEADGSPKHDVVSRQIGAMVTAIDNKFMPLGKGGSVPAAEVEVLRTYKNEGAPNN